MITFKLNGKKIKIPSAWSDLTFRQYLQIFNLSDDYLQLLSLLSGLDYETVKKSIIIGLDSLIEAMSFVNTPFTIPEYSNTLGKYKLPVNSKGHFNVQFESLAQFEDMRAVVKSLPGNDLKAHTEAYARYAAIYLQKIRDGEYDPEKAKAMVEEVMEMPALEVLSAGSFFYVKLMSLLNGTTKTLPNTPLSQKKSKPASKRSRKPSARSRRSRKRP